ncbi:hypothetical protein BJV78DRAFT_1269127 [Lactifluus subvellereus]|nr:hypothetical protein BJV78DRAFT_1269127 [Lactifluus subvellereus]
MSSIPMPNQARALTIVVNPAPTGSATWTRLTDKILATKMKRDKKYQAWEHVLRKNPWTFQMTGSPVARF